MVEEPKGKAANSKKRKAEPEKAATPAITPAKQPESNKKAKASAVAKPATEGESRT